MLGNHETFAPEPAGPSAAGSDALRQDFFSSILDSAMPAQVERVSAPAEIPAPVVAAMDSGAPIRFSSAGENAASNRQPDYFLTPEGKLVKNEQAPPNSGGGINIEIQTQKPEDNKSLKDAITHQTEMQKDYARDMIRLFQKNNPGKPVPGWMESLANAKPNIPDFVPFQQPPNRPVTPPPENGFVNRGVSGGGSGGFANNGGFDSGGMFRGNGGSGDGSISTGGTDSRGQPIGPGETVQAKQIYDYLTTQHQLSPAVASGILGNMMTESGFKTNAYNAGEGAIGLCQWEGGRRTNLERFAANEGKPVTDWRVQVDFMMHELKGSESGAFAKLQQAQTPGQAAALFDKYFERSSGHARGQRMANAENIHQKVATTATA